MKVTLRKRLLKTGRISLYLDHCPPIIHPESGKICDNSELNVSFGVLKSKVPLGLPFSASCTQINFHSTTHLI